MLIGMMGTEFTFDEALQELLGGGSVIVAPDESRLCEYLRDLDNPDHRDEILAVANYDFREDIAYIETEDDEAHWTVYELLDKETFGNPAAALRVAMSGTLAEWRLLRKRLRAKGSCDDSAGTADSRTPIRP